MRSRVWYLLMTRWQLCYCCGPSPRSIQSKSTSRGDKACDSGLPSQPRVFYGCWSRVDMETRGILHPSSKKKLQGSQKAPSDPSSSFGLFRFEQVRWRLQPKPFLITLAWSIRGRTPTATLDHLQERRCVIESIYSPSPDIKRTAPHGLNVGESSPAVAISGRKYLHRKPRKGLKPKDETQPTRVLAGDRL
ncbi:hypothetical protein BJX63DRAFT_147544 [Aspergillus granulosus]|uniref:Secreted protein n=1 Tax=Aspergillus granulosus TaxID=176169 RepID=A0ABR4HN08_9EURO